MAPALLVASASGTSPSLPKHIGKGSSSWTDALVSVRSSGYPSASAIRAQPSELVVLGEPFAVEYEVGRVSLMHSQWSLVGSGASLQEASVRLFEEAGVLAELMASDTDSDLSEEAQRLRRYVLRLR